MKKEWIKPSIIDFSNSNINSGTEPEGTPETIIRCSDGMELALMNAAGTGKSSTTFETCS